MTARTARRALASWMERPGNWRMKALLAAALPDAPYTAEEIGEALRFLGETERGQEVKRHHLSKRFNGREPPAAGPSAPQRAIRVLGNAYPSDYKEPQIARELANDGVFKERELEEGTDLDSYMGRMLTSDSTTEKDVLWREQLLDSIIMGAEEAQVARDASNVIEVDTQQGDHPVRGDDVFAKKIARGASIPFDEENWSTASWKTEKWGLGAYVTEELIDQALIDVIEQEMRNLGRAAENAVNRVFMNNLVDNGGDNGNGASIDTGLNGGSAPFAIELDNLLNARNEIIKNNWPSPDTITMHPDFQMGVVAGGSVAAGRSGGLLYQNRRGEFTALGDGEFPAGLMGLENAFVVPDGPYNGSNNWGFDTDTHVGAVMYVRELLNTYIRRDIETKDFEDPIRDLEGANVRVEVDSVWGQSGASAFLEN